MAKRMSYTNEFKLKVIKLGQEKSNRSAAKEFGISEELVRGWKKMKSELEKLPRG